MYIKIKLNIKKYLKKLKDALKNIHTLLARAQAVYCKYVVIRKV